MKSHLFSVEAFETTKLHHIQQKFHPKLHNQMQKKSLTSHVMISQNLHINMSRHSISGDLITEVSHVWHLSLVDDVVNAYKIATMKIDSRFNFWLNFETKWMKAHPYHGRLSVDCEIASNLLFCIMNTNKRWWEYSTSKEEERHESRNRNESRRFYLLIRYVCWFSILMRMLLCRSNELFGVIHQIPLAYQCATNQNDSIHYAYTFFGDILWHSLPPFFYTVSVFGPFWVWFFFSFFLVFFSFFLRHFFPLQNQTKRTFFHFEFRQNGHFNFLFIFSVGEKNLNE